MTEFEPFTKSLSTSHIMAEKAYRLQLHDKLNFITVTGGGGGGRYRYLLLFVTVTGGGV